MWLEVLPGDGLSMSTIIIKEKQFKGSLVELAAMYINGEISAEQYFEALKNSPNPRLDDA